MTQRAKQVLQECQSWSPEEREELAVQLFETLEPAVDEGYHAAWDAEIAKRLSEIENGTVQCIPAEEVHRRLQK